MRHRGNLLRVRLNRTLIRQNWPRLLRGGCRPATAGETSHLLQLHQAVRSPRYSLDTALDAASKPTLFCAIISTIAVDPKCLQFQ